MTVKKAPTSDNRNMLVTVWDNAGEEHKMTLTNAREMVRHSRWTMHKEEGEARKIAPAAPVAKVNDGQPQPQAPSAPAAPTGPVWEDISALPKAELRRAAAFLKIGEIDGRSSEKRIAAAIDTTLDQRLSASGDFDGADQLESDADDVAKQVHELAVIARRKRAFELAAIAAGLPVNEEATIASFVSAFAALSEPTGE